jgi:hypothetical protein
MNNPESEEPIEPQSAQPATFKDNNSVILSDSDNLDKNKEDSGKSNQERKDNLKI